MIWAIVCLTSLVVAGLALFSGFGLGTLLMPAFALFFPVEVAVAATAVVHLANNLFKVGLIGKWADWSVAARFAVPAAIAAVFGALLLGRVSDAPAGARGVHAGRTLVLAHSGEAPDRSAHLCLRAARGGPALERLSLDRRFVPVGGTLSGFFGGLSGHQGALRSAFLVRLGLGREALLGTMAVAAVVVDVSRLAVYGATFFARDVAALRARDGFGLVGAATLAAFVGTFAGSRLVKKVTLRTVHRIVTGMLLLLALALSAGLL
jgi:uncharacterized membrane protein YfcA